MIMHVENIKNRIKQTAGFTIAEALVATIILLLVSVIMVTGIPAAINAYNNIVIAANAEMLMSTAMGELRNELSTARDIQVNEETASGEKETEVIFYNESVGFNSRIYIQKSGKIKDIMYQRYYGNRSDDSTLIDPKVPEAGTGNSVKLVSDAASDKDKELHVYYGGANYTKGSGVIEFTDLIVTDKNGKNTKTARGSYKIRVITD